MAEGNESKASLSWVDDSLDRKPLADHLTKSLTNQSVRLGRGLTVALDADWGAGKTFFVREWIKDLQKINHPIVYFDAWENDIGDEASVALMSSILSGLEEWKAKLPADVVVSGKATRLKDDAIRRLRRAVVPVTGIIAKAAVKKALGVGLEEFTEAIGGASESEEASTEADKALDKIFEISLKEHESRQQALKKFRASLSDLLNLLSDHTEAALPLFVFVDEVDRCRPSYAIKLLEEVKHIFGVSGVVYVVSTNLAQLQNSVRAIYGSDFDGRRYLRRLFDREYSLPSGDAEKFAGALLSQFELINDRKIRLGLPHRMESGPSISKVWALICDGFSFDLRTQKQLKEIIEEAADGLPPGKPIYLFWLVFLAGLYICDVESLSTLALRPISDADFADMLKRVLVNNPGIVYFKPSRDFRAHDNASMAQISDVLKRYFYLSNKSVPDLFHMDTPNIYSYPESLLDEVREELGNSYNPAKPPKLSLSLYAKAVLRAGYLVGELESLE